MAKTYSPGATNRDRLRFRLADTVTGDPTDGGMVLDNAEIDDLLATYSFPEACAQGAEAIAAYFFRLWEEIGEDDSKESYRNRAQGYIDLAAQIRKTAQSPGGPGPRRGATGVMSAPDLTNYRQ
jgi:hypothetical protein